ncbi:uncharacterized protein A4U43_C10F14560 [Asparagus officinalis]|uniref:Uncharacterized protein n=1 Tax=Asparagus officinalis TaxID=4686 RepID=A0A5P1E2Q0_ASPOF|nr:uncharacterized protein A4U43_C10F14560 [Asparagus officinalis]
MERWTRDDGVAAAGVTSPEGLAFPKAAFLFHYSHLPSIYPAHYLVSPDDSSSSSSLLCSALLCANS